MLTLSLRVAGIIALTLLCGCAHSEQNGAIPPAQLGGVNNPERMLLGSSSVDKTVIFAASLGKQSVVAFNGSGKAIATMRTGVGPLATDSSGNLFVTPDQEYYVDKLKIFAPPYTGSPTVIHIPGQIVGGIAVDQLTGVFAVVSDSARPGGGPSRITFFRRGGMTPCNIVHQPKTLAVFGSGAAFDREGVLFFTAGSVSGGYPLASTAGECNAKTVQVYPFRSIQDYLAFNAHDDLVVQAYTAHGIGTIYTYALPRNGKFGSPISTTKLQPEKGFVPIFHSMSSDGRHLWADYINNNVELFDYPAGGAPLKSFPVYNAAYAAVYPALIP